MLASAIPGPQPRIGTSGWVYGHWNNGVFYPPDLRGRKQLQFYVERFNTVELNGPHYRTPSQSTVRNWYESTPENFVFAWKMSKYVTHWHRLRNCYDQVQRILENAVHLREKLGPILVQLPPNHRLNPRNLQELQEFLEMLPQELRVAVEFRNDSWYEDATYNLLKKEKAVLVRHDHYYGATPDGLPMTDEWAFVRRHGITGQCWGSYGDNALTDLAHLVQKDSYVYFNNDIGGAAPTDAKRLIGLVESRG